MRFIRFGIFRVTIVCGRISRISHGLFVSHLVELSCGDSQPFPLQFREQSGLPVFSDNRGLEKAGRVECRSLRCCESFEMGIAGLLGLVAPAMKDAHLEQFRGKVVAVDAMCWYAFFAPLME